MSTLIEEAEAAVKEGNGTRSVAYGRDFARALIVAEELANAIETEVTLGEDPQASRDARLKAALVTDAALTAYREATGGQP